jgi:Holliday junction DNA helicase RuvA
VIASLRGPVLRLAANTAVIECGGVGLEVVLTPSARDQLRQGEEGTVLTYLVVREDSLTLYGLASQVERDVFVAVQGASGVGPKLALALVSTLGAAGLAKAVASEDLAALVRVPGIGRKGAQKLILSLGGKLAPFAPVAGDGSEAGGIGHGMGATVSVLPGGALAPGSVADQVQTALVGLGFPAQTAQLAVASALAEPEAPSDVAALLRAALSRLRAAR